MNQLFQVSKEIEFDYAHRVPLHDSGCKNMHGHRGRVVATVEGVLVPTGIGRADEGMVLDFKKIKEVLMDEVHGVLDHRCILYKLDPLNERLKSFAEHDLIENSFGYVYQLEYFGWVQEIVYIPTAENLALLCMRILSSKLNGPGCKVVSIEFWETPTSCAKVSV